MQFLAYGVEFPSDKDRHPDSPEPPEFKLDSEIISWIGEMGIQVAGNHVVSGDDDTTTTESILAVTRVARVERLCRLGNRWSRDQTRSAG